jgi:AcrR family transcriptional regulator
LEVSAISHTEQSAGREARGEATTTHPDGRKARGDATRRAILGRAMQIASVEGLEGLSLGRLADDLGMSKSGLFAHFGSKEELQLATLRAARAVFGHTVVEPVLQMPEGIERLAALTLSWLDYIEAELFAGGCLFLAASSEFDDRPGPVRDTVAEIMGEWVDILADQVRIAREHGELHADEDPIALAWELHAFELALNWDYRLNRAPAAGARARAATRGRLHAAATAAGRRTLARVQ